MTDWRAYLGENTASMNLIDEKLITDFFQVLSTTRAQGGKVWVLGNGGSASTAAHAVGDFGKTSKSFGAAPLLTIAPSEMTALQTAYANDKENWHASVIHRWNIGGVFGSKI
jgi:D-sedoheptulose 7-phosphate isomerase